MVGVYVDDVSLPDLNKIKMNVKNQMETVDLVQCYKTCRFVDSIAFIDDRMLFLVCPS
jgi:hypothetical protein